MTLKNPTFHKASERPVPHGLLQEGKYALQHYGLFGTLARFLLMKSEMRRFVRLAKSPEDKVLRGELLRDFAAIHANVVCAHSPFQFVLMAEYLLGLDVPGPIVECGCYKGGSSAKLSVLAKKLGRRLYVCDSFAGLPEPQGEGERFVIAQEDQPGHEFSAGDYTGQLHEVQENIRRWGCIDVCEFVLGFFDKSLPSLAVEPAFVFIDVDLVSSARDCLKHLWPRLAPGGLWFTHEASFVQYMEGILDAEFWHTTLGECPPVVFGAGNGLHLNASSIAYFRKKRCGEQGGAKQAAGH